MFDLWKKDRIAIWLLHLCAMTPALKLFLSLKSYNAPFVVHGNGRWSRWVTGGNGATWTKAKNRWGEWTWCGKRFCKKGKKSGEQLMQKWSHCTLSGSEVFGHICHLQQTVALFLEKCIMHYVDAKKERFSFILDQNILYSLFLAIGPPGIQISSWCAHKEYIRRIR